MELEVSRGAGAEPGLELGPPESEGSCFWQLGVGVGARAGRQPLPGRGWQLPAGRGCANCQSLPQAELFVRQRERPGLRSPAVSLRTKLVEVMELQWSYSKS